MPRKPRGNPARFKKLLDSVSIPTAAMRPDNPTDSEVITPMSAHDIANNQRPPLPGVDEIGHIMRVWAAHARRGDQDAQKRLQDFLETLKAEIERLEDEL